MKNNKALAIAAASLLIATFSTVIANATHSWGGYHWARTANPFTLQLGDNLSNTWDPYLIATSTDWSVSDKLNTTIVAGLGGSTCKATTGRVEVCNKTYGNNGWLGIAQIWASGSHIVKGTVKVNDTYFSTGKYNTNAWRNLVMCQEVGHTLGLGHQDENFTNTNLGTCMDYTNDPDGTLANPDQLKNERPNAHDYSQLDNFIYAHFDTINTVGATTSPKGNKANVNTDDPSSWGKEIRKDARGGSSLFEKDLGNGEKLFTFVIWAG